MTPKPEQQWVTVAIVLRPHALGGGLVLKPLTRTLEEFMEAPLERVFARRRNQILRELKIEGLSVHKNAPLAYFEGLEDRNAVEELIGCELVIPESERWPLPEGVYYEDQLVGLEVVDGSTGEVYGKVLKIVEGSAHDFIVFPNPRDERKEVMLPKVPQFVSHIDLTAGQVVVSLPEGLLEL